MFQNLFNALLAFSLNNRRWVIILAIMWSFLGLFIAKDMPIDVLPNLNKPTITLMTELPGKSALEVEQITNQIQSQMNGLNGLEVVRSTSSMGLSIVYLNFKWGEDIYKLRQMVSERLINLESSLPDNVSVHMTPVSSIMGEVMLFALPIKSQSQEAAMQAREYVDFNLRPQLLSISGVAQITPIGGMVRQYKVVPNLLALQAAGITLDDLKTQLSQFGKNSSAGFVIVDQKEWMIQNLANKDLSALQQMSIYSQAQQQSIALNQLADVSFAPAIKRGDALYNGKAAVIVGVQKQPNADTIQITKALEEALGSIKSNQLIDRPVVTFKQADFINYSINNLTSKLLSAAGIVAIIVWLFLGNFRSTLVVITALPLSLITALLCFKYFGLTINTMTLGGLAISIGELVDDAIVDLENCIRRYQQAKKNQELIDLKELIKSACIEVRGSVLYATLIIIMVFVPLLFLPGMEGKLFQPLGFAYIAAILSSLLVAVTLTPVLAYYIVPKLTHTEPKFLVFLQGIYTKFLYKLFNQIKLLTFALAGLLICAVMGVIYIPKIFLPPFNEGSVLLDYRLTPGMALQTSRQNAEQISSQLKQIEGVQHVGVRMGRAELDEHAEGVHVSEFDVKFKPDLNQAQTNLIFDKIRNIFDAYEGSMSIGQPISHRIDHLLSGVRAPIVIKIFGTNTTILREQAAQLQQKLKKIQGLSEVNLEKQRLIPYIFIKPRANLSMYGLNEAYLLDYVQSLLIGQPINQIIDGNKKFNLVLQASTQINSDQNNLQITDLQAQLNQLEQLQIPTPSGNIALNYLAEIVAGESINQISQENAQRRMIVSANLSGDSLSNVAQQVNQVLKEHILPSGYYIKFDGQYAAQNQANQLLMGLALLALIAMVALLYQLYKNWLWVALVLTNIPFAMLGSVALLWLTKTPLSIAAMVGFIALAGIAARNGILKISYYLHELESGKPFTKDLILDGAKQRLSPVLMTALTASLALLPLVIQAHVPGSEILHPVAVVIVGGLLSSTLIDSIMTPLWFYRLYQRFYVK
jgi:heavy-metal exporter, HME family